MSSTIFQEKLKALYSRQNKIAPLIEGLEDIIPPQSLEDYYVKLKTIIKVDVDKRYISYEQIPGRKQEIEIEDLFDPLKTAPKTPVNKLLIAGGAGVGKSTLMQYITYKWSRGELWKDKFDYVYRVPLRTLLNTDWDHNYYGRQGQGENDDDDILKCLVHYHLVAEKRGFCSLQDIPWKQEKSLLLLDGYDEVAHQTKGIYKRVFEDIFDHKNIILTSRPDAIDREMAEKFGRRIENIGFDDEGIHHYLTYYFKNDKDKAEGLENHLENNLDLKEICRIPVNIAMICLIWATRGRYEAFQQASNMRALYHHVVDYLGFRYYAKQEINAGRSQEDLECQWKGQEINLDELKVLQHCAYKAMTGGGIEVPADQDLDILIIRGMTQRGDKLGVSIQSSINYLEDDLNRKMPTINKVYKYGLLRPDEASFQGEDPSDINLQDRSFSFIHRSFQEFLTAKYFAEKLIEKNNDQEQTNIANFIAQHRNEPRYLMTLKFMAGILSAANGEQADKGVKIFWDAVMCNPDGVLELGAETKVILLMHLLSQVQGDDRIPHQNVAENLIDSVVLRDLAGWSTHLRESGYLRGNIKKGLIQYFANNNPRWLSGKALELQKKINSKLEIENNFNMLDQVDDIMIMISSVINEFSKKEEKMKIFQRVLEILQDYNEAKWQCTRKAIESIIIIHKRKSKLNFYLSTQKQVLDSLLITASDNNLNEISSKAIKEIIGKTPNPALIEELIKSAREGLENLKPELQYRKIKTVIEIFRNCNISDEQFTRDLIHALVVLSKYSNQNVRTSASKEIISLVKIGCKNDSELASYAITDLLRLLKYPRWNVKISASETILELARLNNKKNNPRLAQIVFSALTALLYDGQQHAKTLALKNIVKLVMIDKRLAEDAINIICLILKDSNLDVRISALKKIVELVKIANDIVILREVLKIFIELLGDPDLTIRGLALDNITKLATICDKNDPDQLLLSRNLFKAMSPLLKDPNSDVRISALERITELVKLNGDSQLLTEAVNISSELFHDFEPRVKNSASKNIIKLIKISGLKDPLLFKALLDTLNSLLQDSNPDISASASKNLRKLLDISQSNGNSLVENVIKVLIPSLENPDNHVRKIASESIVQATMQNNKLAKFALDEILRFWENPALDGRNREIEILSKLIKKDGNNAGNHDIQQDVIKLLVQFLKDINCEVRISASNCITEIARNSNDILFIRNIIESTLMLILQDSQTSVRKATSKNIISLFKESIRNGPSLFQEIVDKLLIFSQKSQWNVRTSVSEIIAGLLKLRDENNPQLVKKILRTLTPLLRNPEGYARKAASDSIIGLMHVSATNANDTVLLARVLETLTPLLEDQNSYVRKAASDNIIELIAIIQNPENDLVRNLIKILCPLLQNSESYIRKIASYNIAELVNCMNDQQDIEPLLRKILNVLSPLLRDPKQDNRSLAAKKMLDLARKIDDPRVFKYALEIFEPLLSDSDWGSTDLAAKNIIELMKINDNKDTQLAETVIKTLIPFLKDSSQNIRISASIHITELVKLINDHENTEILEQLTPLLQDLDRDVKSTVSLNMIEIMEISDSQNPKIIRKIFNTLSPLLQDSTPRVSTSASNNLIRLALLSPQNDTQFVRDVMSALTPLFRDYDSKRRASISAAIINLLRTKCKYNAELTSEAISTFSSLLQHPNTVVVQMASTILKGIFPVLLVSPDSLLQYFNHQSKIFRDVLTSSLLGCLQNYVQNFQVLTELFQDHKSSLTLENIQEKLFKSNLDFDIEIEVKCLLGKEAFTELKLLLASKIDHIEDLKGPQIIELALVIINKETVPEDGSDRHKLIEKAKETLTIQLTYLNDEGLKWINENHDKLLSLSFETKSFYQKACHKVLEDDILTPLETELLIKFINHGLTILLTRKGEVIFAGKRYKLKGNDIELALEKIAKTIIGQHQDILAAQYKEHEPIFTKSYQQGGMREAAVDKKEVKSVVDSRNILTNDFWMLTRLRSLRSKSKILLLEQRSAFGDHFICHLSGQKSFRFYPGEIERYQDIFGLYIPGEMYQGEMKELNDEVGQKLLESQEQKHLYKLNGKSYPRQIYFQQELLRGGSEDRNKYFEDELDKKLDNYSAKLQESLKDLGLSETEKQEVEKYYDGFVSTFSAVYTSSQAIAQGKLAIDDGTDYFSLANLFIQLGSLDPFGIGDIVAEGLNAIRSHLVTVKITNDALFVNEIANNYVDLSELTCKTAIDIISNNIYRKKILDAKDDQAKGWLDQVEDFVLGLFDKLKDLVSKYELFVETIERSPAFKLGASDANTIIKKWIQLKRSHQNLKMTLPMRRRKFVCIIVEEKRKTQETVKQGKTNEENEKKYWCCCKIF